MKLNKNSSNYTLKSLRPWRINYDFDSTIPNWQDRLASAYEMLFAKIEEMEKPVIKEKEGENEKI